MQMLLSKKRKSQAAVEFTILFAIALGMLTGFMYFSAGQFDSINEKQIEIDANALGNNMANYAVFSQRTPYLKVKDFRLPVDLGGREYSASLAQDIDQTYLIIKLVDTGREFFFPLKKRVVGRIDKYANYAHCISSKGENTSINPAIIGLEPGRIRKGAGPWENIGSANFDGSVLRVENGDIFSLYVSGNCMHDLKELKMKVVYETLLLSLNKLAESSGNHDDILSSGTFSPYGGLFFDSNAQVNLTFDIDVVPLEISILHLSPNIGPVGSDRLLELVFEANALSAGTTSVRLDPSLVVDDLIRNEPPFGSSIEIMIE